MDMQQEQDLEGIPDANDDRFVVVFANDELNQDIDSLQLSIIALWDKLGLDETERTQIKEDVGNSIRDILTKALLESTERVKNIKDVLKKLKHEINSLSIMLEIPIPEIEIGNNYLEYKENLSEALFKLSNLKQERLEDYEKIVFDHNRLCTILGLDPAPDTPEFLSETFFNKLTVITEDMEEMVNSRQEIFEEMKSKILAIMEETEFYPENVNLFNEEMKCLSDEAMFALDDTLLQAKIHKDKLESEKTTLIEKLSSLWRRLRADPEELSVFLSKRTDCHPCTLDEIKKEIAHCEQMRKENMEEFFSNIRTELELLWGKCHVPQSQRGVFPPIDDISEDDLAKFEDEIERLNKHYQALEPLYDKISKWENSLRLLKELDDKAMDPNRFKNRRGSLLRDEKERRKVERDIPSLRQEIISGIEAYKEASGLPFLYNGKDFQDIILSKETKENSPRANTPSKRNGLVSGNTQTRRVLRSNSNVSDKLKADSSTPKK